MRVKSFLARYAFTLLSFLAVLWLTLAPEPLPDTGDELWPGIDKCAHLLMMGAVCALWLWNRFRNRPVNLGAALLIVVAVAVFAGVIEIIQESMGMGRSGDLGDWEAGCMGIVAAAVAWGLGRASQPIQS